MRATLECPNCSLSLTVHRAIRRARCHYCNYSIPVPKACLKCAGPYLEQIGFGTERVEAELLALFPAARIGRVDRDTIRKRGAITTLLATFARGELDILVGTQMLAKGHDFPRVTLVGVISADVGLGLADFRAARADVPAADTGRRTSGPRREARRSHRPDPLSPTTTASATRAGRTTRLLRARSSSAQAMRYPPSVSMINAVVKARTFDAAMRDGHRISRRLTDAGEWLPVLGPAPAPLSRLNGEHRVQFFLKGTRRAECARLSKPSSTGCPRSRRSTVDVDPVSVL